jgi:hypothetical protein
MNRNEDGLVKYGKKLWEGLPIGKNPNFIGENLEDWKKNSDFPLIVKEEIINLQEANLEKLNEINYISNNPDKYSDYPLNLLTDLNNLIDAELLFILALLYIIIIKSLINYFNKKPLKFSNKKVEKVFLFILDRYTLAWSKYEKFIRTYLIIMLSVSIILSKICIYLILNN